MIKIIDYRFMPKTVYFEVEVFSDKQDYYQE